jgi:hypothetical protein
VDANELQLIHHARKKLGEGFYVNNLRDVVGILRTLSGVTSWPTACFVLQSVALGMVYDWDKQPVTSDRADSVGAQLQPAFCKVLDLMAGDATIEEMCAALDDLVLALPPLRA